MRTLPVFLFLTIWMNPIRSQNVTINAAVTLSQINAAHPTLYVPGSITINSVGSITNSGGILQLGGNIINSGRYRSTGTEKFSGNTDQSISGNFSGTSYLGSMVKMNTGAIILATNLDAATLTFQSDGTLIVQSGKTFTITNSAPSAISNFSNLRYIDVGNGTAFLKRQVASVGTSYAFPIGNSNSGYQRLDLMLSSFGITGASGVAASLQTGVPGTIHFAKNYTNGFSGTIGTSCLVGAHPQDISFECLGTSSWNLSGPNDYQFTIAGYTTGCATNLGPQRIMKAPVGTVDWTPYVESTISGSVTDNLCLYSNWDNSAATEGGSYEGLSGAYAIASSGNIALPVGLLYVSARSTQEKIRIAWSTASEIANSQFHIMRSIDGTSFSEIGIVESRALNGTSTEPLDYLFDDTTPAPRTVYYYRLLQEDLNGTVTPSIIVSAECMESTKPTLSVYPVPSRGIFTVSATLGQTGKSTITITDDLGRTVGSFERTDPGSTTHHVFDLAISPGTYVVRVMSATEILTTPIIVCN